MIVRVREYLRWSEKQRAGEWTRRTLQAIRDDRASEDYRNDPEAL